MDTQLNSKQQLASDKINEFINDPDHKIFYLLGYAGTGKTFLITKLVKNLIINQVIDQVIFCAPTHKALNVLESYFMATIDQTEEALTRGVKFVTIHKLLDFKPVIKIETGQKKFVAKSESAILKQIDKKLVIIDECSMISQDMVKELKTHIDLYPIKIIFMGDQKQLPPVNESESLIFANIPSDYQYHIILDQVMRTKSDSIKKIATNIRNWKSEQLFCQQLLDINQEKIIPKTFRLYHKKDNYSEASWFKNFLKCLNKGKIPIILTWKNVTSNFYNSIIRKQIHQSKDIDQYLVGDYLIFNDYYSILQNKIHFYTSDIVKVLKITTKEKLLYDWKKLLIEKPNNLADRELNIMLKKLANQNYRFNVDFLMVKRVSSTCENVFQEEYCIRTINKNDLIKYQQMLSVIQEHIEFYYKNYKIGKTVDRLWRIYHNVLVSLYANVNFGYSITVHKSQGSTFEIVLVDVQDISDNKKTSEMIKTLYTAATRASSELGFLMN